jgi:hypothetical protein
VERQLIACESHPQSPPRTKQPRLLSLYSIGKYGVAVDTFLPGHFRGDTTTQSEYYALIDRRSESACANPIMRSSLGGRYGALAADLSTKWAAEMAKAGAGARSALSQKMRRSREIKTQKNVPSKRSEPKSTETRECTLRASAGRTLLLSNMRSLLLVTLVLAAALPSRLPSPSRTRRGKFHFVCFNKKWLHYRGRALGGNRN